MIATVICSFLTFQSFLYKFRQYNRANWIYRTAKVHFHQSVDVVEANPTHGVCNIATVLISKVAQGVIVVYELVHVNIDFHGLELRQTEILDLQSFTMGLGKHCMEHTNNIRDGQYLIGKGGKGMVSEWRWLVRRGSAT